MAGKIFECEYHPGEEIVLRIHPPKLLPAEARSHVIAARKEALLALRSLIDAVIEVVEQAEKPETKTRTKIEVE